MDIDILAEQLVNGEMNCCPDLTHLVLQVRGGQMSMEEFKNILKTHQLNVVV
jgi:hypothetical protein